MRKTRMSLDVVEMLNALEAACRHTGIGVTGGLLVVVSQAHTQRADLARRVGQFIRSVKRHEVLLEHR